MSNPMFGECSKCGARMLLVHVPAEGMPCDTFIKIMKRACCPHCGETKQILLCKNEGPEAVTAARGPTKSTPA